MKAEEFKNIIREIIREELQSLTNEEEYDYYRDYRAGLISADEYERLVNRFQDRSGYSDRDRYDSRLRPRAARRPVQQPSTPKAQTPAPPSVAAARTAMLSQMVKYKNADGSEGEASVKSLLGYPKDHPGRKAAARIYAQFMAKNRQQEGICEGEGCLDEKSVPQPYDRKSARKMSGSQIDLRKKIGDAMMRDEKKKSYFRKEYGDEWKDYLWRSASAAAFKQRGGNKGDDKRKK